MVLFAPIIKRRMEEKARREARRENNAAWDAWLKRRDEAQANGQPFDEPSPSQESAKNNDP